MPPALPSPLPALQLRLLGEPAWRRAGGPWQALAPKDAALLALLARDGAHTRERLTALLWPDTPPGRAVNSLRQRVHRLRKACGGPLVLLEDLVRLHPEALHDARAGPGADAPLAPFDYGDCEALAAWLAQWREAWRQAAHAMHEASAAEAERAGDLPAALRATQAALALAPLEEAGWRRLMQLQALAGDRAAALASYERLATLLQREVGSLPDLQTQALRSALLRDSAQAAARQRPAALLPASLLHPPRLVGRAAPWQAMAAAFAAGRAVALLAPAGLGKSRLLRDFLAGRDDLLLVEARLGDADTPYALAARWLAPLLARQAGRLDDFERRELSRITSTLGQAPASAGRQPLLWRAAESVLRRACADGLGLLALEDLHCADAASVELLAWLAAADGLNGLRIVVTARLDEARSPSMQAFDAWLAASTRPERVSLEPWTRDEVAQLLEALDYADAPGIAARLYEHAAGHPFFTLETLKHLALSGRAPSDGGPLPVPPTVQALVERRCAALPPAARRLLELAAVAGERTDTTLAMRVLGLTLAEAAAAWAELEAADMLRGRGFAHALLREFALQALPRAQARALHAAVAEAWAGTGAAAQAEMAAHWQTAGRWAEAAAAWRAAGLAARRAGRLDEQTALLGRAAAACAEAGDAAGRFDALYAALDSVLIRQGGAAMLAAAEALQPLAHTALQRLQVPLARADALLNLHRHAQALELTQALMPLAAGLGEWQADALALHGQALAQAGRHDEAMAALDTAAALARERGDTVRMLHVASARALVLQAAQRPGAAIEAQREALRRASEAGDAAEVALAQGNLATLHMACGQPREALAAARAAQASHREMGSEGGVHAGVALVALGAAAAWHGLFDEAGPAFDAALRILDPSAGGAAHAKARSAAALAALLQGDPARACTLLADLLPDTPPLLKAQALLVRARAQRSAGSDPAPALAEVRALLAATPALARHPAVLVEAAALLPDLADAAALDAAVLHTHAQGATGIARSLRCLRALHTGAPADAAALQALADELPLGTHAGLAVAAAQAALHQRAAPRDAGDARGPAVTPG